MDRRLVTGDEMKLLDEHTINEHGIPSLVLMERAALASVEILYEEDFDLTRTEVICGAGNNGGDGFAVARLLYLAGTNVKLIFVGDTEKRSEETRKQQEIAESYEMKILGLSDIAAVNPTTIIDAVFGIGALRPPTGKYLEAIRYINDRHSGRTKVLSIDIPSGVSADTGETPGEAVSADVTVTFAYQKVGLTIPPGSILAGKIILKDIGIY